MRILINKTPYPQDVTQRNSLSSKVREWREFPKIVDKEAAHT